VVTHVRGGGPVVAVAVILGVPLLVGAVLAVWALAASPLRSAERPRPVVAEVQAAERDNRVATTVAVHPAPEVVVRSQSTGTVTASALGVGEPVRQGDVALVVDGRPIVAYIADAPLFRDVTAGLRGDDVTTVRRLLTDLGYLGADDGDSDTAMVAAIRGFNTDHGRGADDETLSPDSVLWIPADSSAPQAVSVRVGDVVQAQSELYTTTSGSAAVQIATPAVGVARVLSVGTASVPLPAGSDEVTDPGDVAELLAVMAGQEASPAVVADEEPEPVGTIPASAVIVDTQGTSCYLTGVDGDVVRVDADAGGLGLVDVDVALVGTPVLVNPRSVVSDLSCAS